MRAAGYNLRRCLWHVSTAWMRIAQLLEDLALARLRFPVRIQVTEIEDGATLTATIAFFDSSSKTRFDAVLVYPLAQVVNGESGAGSWRMESHYGQMRYTGM